MGCRKRRNKIMCRQRCTANLLVTVRCAVQAFFICCGCGSSAASSRAVQLEQPKASKREREQESRGSKSIARSSRSLQDAFAVDFCSPPPLFVKENDHFHSPSQKNPPAAPPKMATLPCFLLGAALRGQNRLPMWYLSSPSATRGCRYPGETVGSRGPDPRTGLRTIRFSELAIK